MVAPSDRKPKKQVNSENVEFFNGTVRYTGGSTFERRYESEYGKLRHRESDEREREEAALYGPNISQPRILGGVRES